MRVEAEAEPPGSLVGGAKQFLSGHLRGSDFSFATLFYFFIRQTLPFIVDFSIWIALIFSDGDLLISLTLIIMNYLATSKLNMLVSKGLSRKNGKGQRTVVGDHLRARS